MPDAPRSDPRWLRRLVVCAGVGLVPWMVAFVGLVIGSKPLWVPATALFPLAIIGVVVCQVVLVRRALASRKQ